MYYVKIMSLFFSIVALEVYKLDTVGAGQQLILYYHKS